MVLPIHSSPDLSESRCAVCATTSLKRVSADPSCDSKDSISKRSSKSPAQIASRYVARAPSDRSVAVWKISSMRCQRSDIARDLRDRDSAAAMLPQAQIALHGGYGERQS